MHDVPGIYFLELNGYSDVWNELFFENVFRPITILIFLFATWKKSMIILPHVKKKKVREGTQTA